MSCPPRPERRKVGRRFHDGPYPEERPLSAILADEPRVALAAVEIEAADIAVAETLGAHRNHGAVRAVGAMSEIADQMPAYALSGAVLGLGLIAGRMKVAEAGGRMLASLLVATALKSVAKRIVARTRPHMLLDEGEYELTVFPPDDGDWQSFPSGHTADAVAGARALARVFPTASGPAYAAAAVIGAVQIPRAKHYPLDVAAGALVGLAAEAIVDGAARVAFGRSEGTDR
jgi:PAP2 superfamily